MIRLFVTILLCLLPPARSGDCDLGERGFKWTGKTVKAIRDCDMLRKRMTIHLNEFTNKPNCLTYISVSMGYLSIQWTNATLALHPERHGGKLFFTNPLSKTDSCKTQTISIRAKVFDLPIQFQTTFVINPQNCTTATDVSFHKYCYKQGRL